MRRGFAQLQRCHRHRDIEYAGSAMDSVLRKALVCQGVLWLEAEDSLYVRQALVEHRVAVSIPHPVETHQIQQVSINGSGSSSRTIERRRGTEPDHEVGNANANRPSAVQNDSSCQALRAADEMLQ